MTENYHTSLRTAYLLTACKCEDIAHACAGEDDTIRTRITPDMGACVLTIRIRTDDARGFMDRMNEQLDLAGDTLQDMRWEPLRKGII